jgi:hypothetical protein
MEAEGPGVLRRSTDLRVKEKPNILHKTVIENFQKGSVVKGSYSRAIFRSILITPSHSAATPKWLAKQFQSCEIRVNTR